MNLQVEANTIISRTLSAILSGLREMDEKMSGRGTLTSPFFVIVEDPVRHGNV